MSKSIEPVPTPVFVACPICGHKAAHLGSHLVQVHNLTASEYREHHPHHPLASPELLRAFASSFTGIRTPLLAADLRIEIAGHTMPINLDVLQEDCLPIPDAYHLPKSGVQSESIRRTARAIRAGRSVWAAGPPGTGKDAFFHYFCGITRTPSLCLSIQPAMDIDAWFFRQNFEHGKLIYEEGVLTKALRDGYRTTSGRVIPYLILITDADRATPQQAEAFRLVADSIQGRIQGPQGQTYTVLPGTVIVMTANSTGAGDERGMCISSNIIDASLLDRINRFVQYVEMEWDDIVHILREKFPQFAADPVADTMFETMAGITTALRRAINENRLAGTFTHRGLERWIGDCQDLHLFEGRAISLSLLQDGFAAWLDGLPDEPNRRVARQITKPFFEKLGNRSVSEDPGRPKV